MVKHKRRVPYIEQVEQSECGLSALAMILSYYYCEYSLIELRERWSIGRDGLNLLFLKKIAIELKCQVKGFKVNDIKLIPVPSILHINNNHFVVVEKVNKKHVKIVDPDKGKYKMTIEDFLAMNVTKGLYCYPTEDFESRKKKSNFNEYRQLLNSQWHLILTILLCTLLLQSISLMIPISIKFIADNIFDLQSNGYLKIMGVLILFIIAFNWLLNWSKQRIIVLLQARFDQKLMSHFIKKLLNIPLSFFQMRSSGDLIHRYSSSVIVREILSNRIVSIWLDIGLIIIYLLYMISLSLKLAIVISMMAMIQVMLLYISVQKNKELLRKEVMYQNNTTNFFVEITKSIEIIKTKGAETIIFKKWLHLFEKQIQAMKERGKFSADINSLIQSIRFSAPILILWIAVNEVIANRMSIGGMFSMYTISVSLLMPISSMVLTINDIMYVNVYFNRILDVIHTKSEQNINTGKEVTKLKGSIKVDNVSFKYGMNSCEILKNINLNINNGEFVAIVGETGSGKSSLASLMIGLAEPTQGNIYLDNINIMEMNKSMFRSKIGVVSQDMYLFNQSIKNNISFTSENVESADIVLACKNAEIYDEIMRMPMGFETIISENGMNLSGGQRQRIVLARALLQRPSILFLDEATSALDTITEAKIKNNLHKLQCTCIVIAHRLNTIINADKIIVLKDGEIEGVGTHKVLLDKCSYYSKLYNRNISVKKDWEI